MEKNTVIDRVFLLNPAVLGFVEWGGIVGAGILGILLSWQRLPGFPVINMFGGVLFILSFWFHYYCEKTHKQAHESSKNITAIVTSGIYAEMRHPIYLSMIGMNIGLGLVFGTVVAVAVAVICAFSWPITAIKEEQFLLQKFPHDYRTYMQAVKWRIIPNVF